MGIVYNVGNYVQHRNDPKQHGVVISNYLVEGLSYVAIQWKDATASITKEHVDNLQEYNIEEEFNALKQSVNEKIRVAAKVIKEASILASTGVRKPQRGDLDLYPIEKELSQAGWANSNC